MCGSRYESFRVATLALVFTWMRLQVIEERRVGRRAFPGGARLRTLAPGASARGPHAGSDRVLLGGNHSPRVRAEERARPSARAEL